MGVWGGREKFPKYFLEFCEGVSDSGPPRPPPPWGCPPASYTLYTNVCVLMIVYEQ